MPRPVVPASPSMKIAVKGTKQFFFEKKNQKTFGRLSRFCPERRDSGVKVFCFFFSKKKALLAYRLLNWKLRRAFALPYFLRSTTRLSRVRNPAVLRIGRKSGS